MNNATQFANDFIEGNLISEGKRHYIRQPTSMIDSMILLNEKKN